jgi:transcriptional regulator with XRE-family HTH domain
METLRRLRTEKGLSQARLAARAELDPSTVNQIERGAREASPSTLHKLADALDVSLYELLEGEPSPKALRRSSLEPSFNDVRNERRAGVTSWAAYTRQIAGRVRGHADDPDSPAFRDPWAAFFFVEEANHIAADLVVFVDQQLSAALEVADTEAMHDLMAAFEELNRAIDTASRRAHLMEAGRGQSELGEARRRAKEAAAERESVTAGLSGHTGHSA